MTLLVMEGFEAINQSADSSGSGWTGNHSIVSPGRLGGKAGQLSFGGLGFTPSATVIAGWAMKITSTSWMAGLYSSGSQQVYVRWNSDNSLTLYRGGTAVHTSPPNTCFNNTWNYVELKVVVSSTVGSHAIRLNGVPVANMPDTTNVNTNPAGTGSISQWYTETGQAFANFQIDDIYVCNGSGSTNNNFLGDVRVETLFPNAAGSSTGWAPSAGANWDCVNESPANDATDYVTASGVGVKDLYGLTDLETPIGTVFGVQCDIKARKSDSGTRQIQGVFRSGASEADTTTFIGLTAAYQYFREIREDKPGGSGWTIAEVNAMEAGVKVTV